MDASKAVTIARSYVGKPYQFGASGPDSFDCAGLVWTSLHKAFGLRGQRPSYVEPLDPQTVVSEIIRFCDFISDRKPGDVVVIKDGDLVHLGILGFGEVIHAHRGIGKVLATPLANIRIRSGWRLRRDACLA